MKKQFYLLLAFGFLSFPILAQKVKPITKATVLSHVLKQNSSIKIAQQEFLVSEADFKQTKAIFLPNVKASYTAIHTTNPLMAFGSKLNQEILTSADFDPNLLNHPDAVTNFATKIEVQQPLINVDGLYQRKAARTKMEATQLQIQRTKEYLNFEVEKAYMQLQVAYKTVEVLEKTLETVRANKKVAQNSFKQGYLQKADVLLVDVRVTEVKNQLQKAKSNIKNASDYILFLMNETENIILQPLDVLKLEKPTLSFQKKVSKNRADIQAMQQVSITYKNLNKADKMVFLPRLNAFGSYELYDDKILSADANGYLVGAQLSWDIFQGNKRFGAFKKSKAQYQKAALEYEQYYSKSELELNKAKRMLQDAKNNVSLTKLALEQSKEALRIRTNRFKEGLEKTSDVLFTETQFAQKQLEYYQTIYQYNYAVAYIQFLIKE